VDALASLHVPVGSQYFEPENCAILYGALSQVSPYEARDERFLGVSQSHIFTRARRARWPIPTDDKQAVSHIAKHFFARDKRQVERDNVGSRLWWMAIFAHASIH